MTAIPPPPGPGLFRRFELWLPLVIVLLDQLTKALIRRMLPLHESVTVIPRLMDFTHIRNTGAAFGFLDGVDFPFKTVVIAVVATAALIGVAWYAAGLAHHQTLARAGLALIIGGAAGNLIDRIAYGYVVDFLEFYLGPYHWPSFNIADSAISVGVALLAIEILRNETPGRT